MRRGHPGSASIASLLVFVLLFLLTPGARAQTPSPLNEWQYSAGIALKKRFDPDPPHWEALLGFGAEYLPRFEGSNSYYTVPGPTIDIRYRDLAFFSTGEGLGINLLRNVNYRAGVALTYDLGRSEGTYYRLEGRGDLSPSPSAKMFGEYVLFPAIARIDARYNMGGVGGWIGDASLYAPVAGNDHFFIFAGGTVTIADRTNMRHAFGVDQQQSTNTGDPVYIPNGGFKSAGVGVNATYIFNEHWFLDGVAAATRFLGPASGSPVVVDKWQYAFSVSIAYDFRWAHLRNPGK